MHKRDGFSAKTLGKSLFHFQTDWSGKGPAGQFWQMESAQSKDNLTMARADLTNWPMAERQIEHRRSCSVLSPRFGVLIWRCDVFAKSALRKLPILEYISFCKLLQIQGKITFMYMYVCPYGTERGQHGSYGSEKPAKNYPNDEQYHEESIRKISGSITVHRCI